MSSLGTYLEYIGLKGVRVPRGHWKNKENHKKFIDWLRKKEGYQRHTIRTGQGKT